MNMQKLLKQAQDMQDKMQREMGDIVESTSVGGDLVGISMNGHKKFHDCWSSLSTRPTNGHSHHCVTLSSRRLV